ncbi:MAG TPA: hypothetical protein VFP78_20830 [Solirubrobacteraceae bacterium]|nr:hypothetical protein [Solirubrobacteraceae bacterium]
MTIRHAALLIGAPLAFSVLLWLHPMVGDWEGLKDATARFQIVHVGMVLALPLVALGRYLMLDGLDGRAAATARVSLVVFAIFYVPYVAFEGIGLGVLGQELNGLTAAQRDAVAPGMTQDFARNPILGEPGVFWAIGSTAWTVVSVATVLAFRRAGAPTALQVLLGMSVLIVAHTPPLAPIGLVCFAAAGWMVLRARHPSTDEPVAPATASA